MIMVPILTASFIHFSLKGCETLLFEVGSKRVKGTRTLSLPLEHCGVCVCVWGGGGGGGGEGVGG